MSKDYPMKYLKRIHRSYLWWS